MTWIDLIIVVLTVFGVHYGFTLADQAVASRRRVVSAEEKEPVIEQVKIEPQESIRRMEL